jgi:hypothetical protein
MRNGHNVLEMEQYREEEKYLNYGIINIMRQNNATKWLQMMTNDMIGLH